MATMSAKYGSFRYNFAEKRERLLSKSELIFPHLESLEAQQPRRRCCSYRSFSDSVVRFWKKVQDVSYKAVQMGKSDPRKVVFSAKMGLALVLISLLIFLREPVEDLSRYSVWAILTVVVVFEFSIGATLSKGFNRGLGTLIAGGLALGMAELSTLAGDWEELLIIISIFIIGSLATYAKLYPTMKPYEYGFRVFLLTYCFIMVSGYRTREFLNTAATRFMMIALGAGVGLAVNVFIYPIWAGEDLHNLVVKNFMGVANSLEGCVKDYLKCVEYKKVPSKILTYQASDDPIYSGYRSAVESTSQEDALLGFAIWEPPHGPYRGLKYPWKGYVRAPAEKRLVFHSEIYRIGIEGAKVLRQLGDKVKRMEKLDEADILFEVHEAAEALQTKIDKKSYLFVNSENWEIGSRTKEAGQPQDLINFDDDEEEKRILKSKSLSETVLDLSSVSVDNWDARTTSTANTTTVPETEPFLDHHAFKKQITWPAERSANGNTVPAEKAANGHAAPTEESKTYENASALSLATFMSLLIEFVARLQNLVDAFEDLSEAANFKDPESSR